MSLGITAANAQDDLLEVSQKKETFRQFCLRLVKLVSQWLSLECSQSSGVSGMPVDEVIEPMTKQVILSSVGEEVTMYFCQAEKEKKGMPAFWDAGTAFQTSHERAKQVR